MLSVGDPHRPIFGRSSVKPLQAVGLLTAGLDASGERLALACASHSGEPAHIALVEAWLTELGLSVADLGTPPDLPLDPAAARSLLRAGGEADPLHHNCSGKHTGMLATCLAAGWPTGGYLDPEHPLQRHLLVTVADLCAEPVATTAIDGCGAPLFATSLVGLARAFARLVTSPPGSPERRVADAARAHPGVIGGTGRDVTLLMRHVPGLLAKDGAEGVYAAATAEGAAVALKVDDGAARARVPVLLAALAALGTDVDRAPFGVPVLGGGVPVGEVRAVPLRP